MKKFVVSWMFALAIVGSVFANGIFEADHASGEYKYFTLTEGNRTKQVKAEYIGLHVKKMYFEGTGKNRTLVTIGAVKAWNENNWGEWEEIARGKAAYCTKQDLIDVANSIETVCISEFQGNTIFLEHIKNIDGDYWWWDDDGGILYLQYIYLKR